MKIVTQIPVPIALPMKHVVVRKKTVLADAVVIVVAAVVLAVMVKVACAAMNAITGASMRCVIAATTMAKIETAAIVAAKAETVAIPVERTGTVAIPAAVDSILDVTTKKRAAFAALFFVS